MIDLAKLWFEEEAQALCIQWTKNENPIYYERELWHCFFSQVREIDNTLYAHILLGYVKEFPSTLWVDILLNLFMIEVVIIFQFCFSVKEEAK